MKIFSGAFFSLILLSLMGFYSEPAFAQKNLSETPFIIGFSDSLDSEVLKETRKVNVYLPENLPTDSLKKLPVIVLLDGSRSEDFLHTAGLLHFLSFPWLQIMPPCILVGIENTDRKRDFTFPTSIDADKKNYPTTGGSANFIRFLETELMPMLEKKYGFGGKKSLIGQSLGGLLATEILFTKPQLFEQYIIISPSLWWDNESLLKKGQNLAEYQGKKIEIFLAVGNEGKIMKQGKKKISKKIRRLKKENLVILETYLPDENHANIMHQALYKAFTTLFKKVKK
jgi:predicted alpha/beta superfamily hydrolase